MGKTCSWFTANTVRSFAWTRALENKKYSNVGFLAIAYCPFSIIHSLNFAQMISLSVMGDWAENGKWIMEEILLAQNLADGSVVV